MDRGPLANVRAEIDRVDAAISMLIEERRALVRAAAEAKTGTPSRDEEREREVVRGYADRAAARKDDARETARAILRATRHHS